MLHQRWHFPKRWYLKKVTCQNTQKTIMKQKTKPKKSEQPVQAEKVLVLVHVHRRAAV